MDRKVSVILLHMLILGCVAQSPPQVHILKRGFQALSVPTYVTASEQKDAIATKLRDVGFNLVGRVDESKRVIRVTLGVNQGTQPCGTLHNVRYQIRSNEETEIEVEGKGWTGTCQPNILEQTSRELAKTLATKP